MYINKKPTVFITGATGFIGKKLVKKHLSFGDEVRILTRTTELKSYHPNLKVYYGDITMNNISDEIFENVDIVYHCAAELNNESKIYSVNVHGTENLLNLSKNSIKRWVQLSSCGVYGPVRTGIITEQNKLNPVNNYEKSKAKADELVKEIASNSNLPFVILRPTTVFGSDMPNNSLRALANLIKKRLFFFVGKPGAIAAYIHVDDVVEALVLCGTHNNAPGNIYNVSNDCELKDMIFGIAKSCNVSEPTLRINEKLVRFLVSILEMIPSFPVKKSRIDALTNFAAYPYDKIKNELGFQPSYYVPDIISEIGCQKLS